MNSYGTDAAPATADTGGRAPRRPKVSLASFRVVAVLHGAAVLLQPVWAGAYLSGDFGALATHATGANVAVVLALVQLIVAICYATAGRGRIWPALAAALLVAGEQAQLIAGYARALALHIPLGVVLVGGAVALAIWVMCPTAALPRVLIRESRDRR